MASFSLLLFLSVTRMFAVKVGRGLCNTFRLITLESDKI